MIPIWEKVTLTIEEAAQYSNIGTKKLHEVVRNPMCTFVFRVGNKCLIKRKEFERFISQNVEI